MLINKGQSQASSWTDTAAATTPTKIAPNLRKYDMVEVETRCSDGRATYVLSIEGSWSIALRGEGEEDGGQMRQGSCKFSPSFLFLFSSYTGARKVTSGWPQISSAAQAEASSRGQPCHSRDCSVRDCRSSASVVARAPSQD